MAGNIIGIHYSDFLKLARENKKRIYYYEGENYLELHFLSEGLIVKTTVFRDQIENLERFFDDIAFIGAIQLTFRLPEPTNISTIVVPTSINPPLPAIRMSDEKANVDIQKEGIEQDGSN